MHDYVPPLTVPQASIYIVCKSMGRVVPHLPATYFGSLWCLALVGDQSSYVSIYSELHVSSYQNARLPLACQLFVITVHAAHFDNSKYNIIDTVEAHSCVDNSKIHL